MRKHFLTTLIAGLAGVVFSATSCDPAESTPDPVFPDFVEKTVAAGETVELSFSANQDWTVSIPAAEAGTYFRLTDGSTQSFAVKGEAGDHTVSVVVIGEQDFENHELTVSMTMGDRTEEIAKITLSALERYMNISGAVFNEAGTDFSKDEAGELQFGPLAETVELIWPLSLKQPGTAPYENYIMVDASVDWTVSGISADWFDLSETKGAAGKTEIRLSCDLSQLPLEKDAKLEGTFTITGEGLDTPQTVSVKVASAYGLSRFIGVPEGNILKFDADGYSLDQGGENTPFIGSIVSAERLTYFFYMPGTSPRMITNVRSNVIKVDDAWDAGQEGVQNRIVSVWMAENYSEESRSSDLIAIPTSMWNEIENNPEEMIDYDDNGNTTIKPEYQKYVVATCQQEGFKVETITCTPISGFEDGNARFEEFSLETLDEQDPDYVDISPILEMGGAAYRVTYLSAEAEGAKLRIEGDAFATISPQTNTWLYMPEYDPSNYIFTNPEFSVYMTGNPESPENVEKGSKAYLNLMTSMSGDTSAMIIFVKNY